MFVDIKEEMSKQKALFDHKLMLDRENTTHDREELKYLNDQLITQVTTLQNSLGLLY